MSSVARGCSLTLICATIKGSARSVVMAYVRLSAVLVGPMRPVAHGFALSR